MAELDELLFWRTVVRRSYGLHEQGTALRRR